MYLKKLLPLYFIALSSLVIAQESTNKLKFYGFVGNDFFYNSRQNGEAVDGLINLFPKPINLKAGEDVNDTPQAEMLSVNTRLGLDITGSALFGAKSSAKIEADFAGFGTSYYVFRIRQAYAKLNWTKTELLVGQAWHPMFGTVMPSTLSANGGAPFQPFNRSPQVRIKYNLSTSMSISAAAIYQMQYPSQGPLAASSIYLKNAIAPNVFLGAEYKTGEYTTGIGIDLKTIKPDQEKLTSFSAVAYTQYVNSIFQLKAKAVLGQNLSDHLMMGGYGVSKLNAAGKDSCYTNFNTASGWVNAIYGTKLQIGILVGFVQNFGTNKLLVQKADSKLTAYGYGVDNTTANQLLIDRLYRIAPNVTYTIQNLKLGIEYDLTSADYGTLNKNGHADAPKAVSNHRIMGTVIYSF